MQIPSNSKRQGEKTQTLQDAFKPNSTLFCTFVLVPLQPEWLSCKQHLSPHSENLSHCRSSVVWWSTVKSNTSNTIWGAAGTQWNHWTPQHPLETGCFKRWWDSAPNLVLQRTWNVAALWISPQWLPQGWWWLNLAGVAEEKSINIPRQWGLRTQQSFLLRSSPKDWKSLNDRVE